MLMVINSCKNSMLINRTEILQTDWIKSVAVISYNKNNPNISNVTNFITLTYKSHTTLIQSHVFKYLYELTTIKLYGIYYVSMSHLVDEHTQVDEHTHMDEHS